MKHESLRWDHVSVHDAQADPGSIRMHSSVGGSFQGCCTETKDTAHKEALQDGTRTEDSGYRFVAKTDEGKLSVCDGVIRAIPFV
jgi:hypothetical protein